MPFMEIIIQKIKKKDMKENGEISHRLELIKKN